MADEGRSDSRELGPYKRIVLCADGTGNSGGKGYPTNVWRLFNAVDLHCHEGEPKNRKQIAFYDDGVGTEDFKLFKLIGGAFGYGLSRNIRELYETLARNYEAGDQIYVFGFSRGAFTARSLVGLIAQCGVVDLRSALSLDDYAELRYRAFRWRTFAFFLHLAGWFRFVAGRDDGPAFHRTERIRLLVDAAFNVYREQHKSHARGSLTWAWVKLLNWLPKRLRLGVHTHDEDVYAFKKRFAAAKRGEGQSDRDAIVKCVGVWDTVGALGAPADWMRTIIDWLWSISFHDQSLQPCVEKGFHALAIDDERSTFEPILWKDDTRVEQVWFSGVHANVGGGYPKQGLACISLYWMMRRAQTTELLFQPGEVERVRAQANVHDKLYDSRAGLAAYYSYGPRDISKLAEESSQSKEATRVRIHYSVFERIASGVQDYIPANLASCFEVVGDKDADIAEPQRDYWRKRLNDSGISARHGELTPLWGAARVWVRSRKVLYYAMLGSTLAFMSALVRLKQKGQPIAVDQTSRWYVLDRLGDYKPGGLVHRLVDEGHQAATFVVETLLPQSLDSFVQPTIDYFAERPGRFLICVLVLVAYVKLRGWLLRRTQAPFEQFWSPLRGPIELRAQPEAAQERSEAPQEELHPAQGGAANLRR